MDAQLWMAALIYAFMLVLLSLSFNLTYNTTGAPNFSTGSTMAIAAWMGFTSTRVLGHPVYLGLPLASAAGSAIGLASYLAVVKPLLRRGRGPVLIAIATMGIEIVSTALLQAYALWLSDTYHLWSQTFLLKQYDFRVGFIPGVFLVSTAITLSLFLFIRLRLDGTRHGVALRALNENPELAQIQGVDPHRTNTLAWLTAGGLAGLAGATGSLWFKSTVAMGPWMMAPIMAASLLGGLGSLTGAVFGGVVLGVIEMIGTTTGQEVLGVWFGEYRQLIPILSIALTCLLRPDGLKGKDANPRYSDNFQVRNEQF